VTVRGSPSKEQVAEEYRPCGSAARKAGSSSSTALARLWECWPGCALCGCAFLSSFWVLFVDACFGNVRTSCSAHVVLTVFRSFMFRLGVAFRVYSPLLFPI
jgi:hypothetical protein